MSNPFLLVVILFKSFSSIHSQHPICKVDDIKIESVIDINSTIKYFVTFDSAYKYWLWNEEDVTKEVGQNLTSKQAFGYDYKHLVCASRFHSALNHYVAYIKVNRTLEQEFVWEENFALEPNGTLSGIKKNFLRNISMDVYLAIDGCAFYDDEIYYVKLNRLTLETTRNDQRDPLAPILSGNLTAIFTYDDALYAVDINGKDIYQLECTTKVNCFIFKTISVKEFFYCVNALVTIPLTSEATSEEANDLLPLIIFIIGLLGIIAVLGYFAYSEFKSKRSKQIEPSKRNKRFKETKNDLEQSNGTTNDEFKETKSLFNCNSLIDSMPFKSYHTEPFEPTGIDLTKSDSTYDSQTDILKDNIQKKN